MRISQSLSKITSLVFAAFLVGLPLRVCAAFGSHSATRSSSPSLSCEDFAQRQIKLADRLLQRSNYTRALKVLNSTAENCDIGPVRKKIVEVLGEWYGVVRNQGSSALQQFVNVLSNQRHISEARKAKFERRIKVHVRGLIEQQYSGENFQAAYRLCRSYSSYVNKNFKAEYFCGTSAEKLGALNAAMDSYKWLAQNWNDQQSMATWKEMASKLEKLYFLNGRFQEAYNLARRRARRDPSPKAILLSLVSARANFLSPVVRAASVFYGNDPSQSALSHVGSEMQRVDFPKYVEAFYILTPDGKVERGMYGKEANQPNASLLDKTKGTVSLLQSTGESNSNLVWLVSPLDERFLVLEFGTATTPKENAQLETVYQNIESDKQWKTLYHLEFTETSPATGSAVGTLLSGASIDNQDWDQFDSVFDGSPLLAYYCIQNGSGDIEESQNFDRSNLEYGDSKWKRTSNTPALYHHSIKYNGQSVREVVWPKFVDEKWTGVVRVGLTHN